ncbi:MAG: DUF5320 family protein [Candidatus Omnitrophica bacterium]|nr:DUF5320 family protein [Candidatus Omnitrophota bacterium]
MKICITSQGNNLDSQVDPRFGRCQYFIIVDTDTLKSESVENSNVAAASGAGIQSGQFMANKGVEFLLTGNIGPNAFSTLQAAGIKIITGITGTIREAIERFQKGEFREVTGPTVASKFGMGGGQTQPPTASGQPQTGPTPVQPQGPGFGVGMGPGMGMGMGWQQPMPGWQQPMPGWQQPMPGMYQPPQMSKQQELQMLKGQVEFLGQQMDLITKRIDELSKE